jgi:transcriptional regulator with XRE-family HTH domain
MTTPTTTLSLAIGTRVRAERLARGWTLDRLANAAGVSRRMLVNVEKGEANPSVGSLLKISDALEVALPVLVEPPEPAMLRVTHRADASVLWRSEAGGSGTLVAGTAPPDAVELWDWSLASGDAHASNPHPPGTRELLHVISGELTVEVGPHSERLKAGDAAVFSADTPHRYLNAGRRPTRFMMTVFVPGESKGHDQGLANG